MDIALVIIALSIIFQIIAGFFAIRLITIYKKYSLGILLNVMIVMQTFRRSISFYRVIFGGHIKIDIYAEIAALVVSMILVFWILYMLRVIKELTGALDNIKIFKGLLPICASCKKIRNDDKVWVQMESYISQHSEAKFSHGVCEECAKKLYPSYNLEVT